MTLNTRVANLFSYVLHPVFIPSYLILSFYFVAPQPLFYSFMGRRLFVALFFMLFIYSVVFPLLITYYLYRIKVIPDITAPQKKHRNYLYLYTAIFFVILIYFLGTKGTVFLPTRIILAGVSINILGLFLINIFDKVSIHASAVAGAVGVFCGLFLRYSDGKIFVAFLVALILLGLVSTSRLRLGAHNLRQVFVGSLWGFITGFASVYFFMRF